MIEGASAPKTGNIVIPSIELSASQSENLVKKMSISPTSTLDIKSCKKNEHITDIYSRYLI